MKALKKVLLILVLVIIIAGIVMISIKGFNYSLLYSKAQRMNIYIDKDYNIETIKEVAKEVLGENAKVQQGTHFNTVVSILNSEISEEQQNSIVEKLQEKLEIEIDKDKDIAKMDIPQANIWDMISKYIAPIIAITAVYLLFILVRFRNKGLINTLLWPTLSVVLALLLYTSIYALVRIPVNELFTICAMLVFLITLLFNIIKLNRD